jgi:hypothetical protein
MVPVIAKEYFGTEYAGTAPGLLYAAGFVGYIIGPPTVGYLFDIYRSYLPGSIFTATNFYVAFILLFFVTKSNRSQGLPISESSTELVKHVEPQGQDAVEDSSAPAEPPLTDLEEIKV